MIQFEEVSKTFNQGSKALEKVTFTVEDNEFVFLVGPSGAGKTTILKLLLNEYAPTTGTITIDNFQITPRKLSHVERLRRKIGMVFQDFKILPEKSVFENIALSLKVLNKPQTQIKSLVEESLNLVGLPDKKHMFPVQLSAGELQRIAIARAIIGDRNIILADEPTGNLDPTTTWEIMKILKRIEGTRTLIIATHNTDIVNSLKKRVIMMKDGKIAKDIKKGGYEL